MALNAVVEDITTVPEGLRDYYEETDDGKYVLSVEDVDNHPSVANLKHAYEQEKGKRKKTAKERDTVKNRVSRLLEADPEIDLSDVDDDTLAKALAVIKGDESPGEGEGDPGEGQPGKKKGEGPDLDKIKANARKPLERELETTKTELQKWQGLAQRTLIDNAIASALTRVGVKDPDYRELLTERFRRQCRIEESDDGEFSVLMEGEYGEMEPGSWVKEWANTDYAKKFIGAPENTGGGANGGGSASRKGPNPWKKDTYDFNEQMRIAREDPERAKKMAAEAGVKLPL